MTAQVEKLQRLRAERDGAAVEAADHKGETPARHAARKGRAEVLRLAST